MHYTFILSALLGTLSAVCAAVQPSAPQFTDSQAASPVAIDERVEAAGVPEWGLGPFLRAPENPILTPQAESVFRCPIQDKLVNWEAKNVVGAAAVVRDDQVYLLYRAEPLTVSQSRIGLAMSTDGLHFRRLPQPVFYPDNDACRHQEWPGGTEDGRIVQRADGLYVYLYPAFDGKRSVQYVATSRDLVFWTPRVLDQARLGVDAEGRVKARTALDQVRVHRQPLR